MALTAAAPRRERDRMVVADVVATPEGQFVVILKTEATPLRFLPIWIGESEAIAIQMRLRRTEPPRPLTLNLLETVMTTGNIKLLEINIDSLKGDVYLGKLKLKSAARTWEVDARPSDAIGLALGRDAAIWVAREVLDRASIGEGELRAPRHAPSPSDAERRGAKPTRDESL
ncbi:MAG: bifunctional nuclease family protein [Deltaproteobacteria bacterium]|nr:bifunctional nuclease family protein [Deltaproteobacteria bacterium]